MSAAIQLLFPETALASDEVREVLDNYFDECESLDGLVSAECDAPSEDTFRLEALLKAQQLPFDLWITDGESTTCVYHRPGAQEPEIIVAQDWRTGSLDPMELSVLLAKTPDSQLRTVLFERIQSVMERDIAPLESLVDGEPMVQGDVTHLH